MAKGARGERTREDILRASARLFAIHGYYHTSTQDILEAVSISKGAFYHHFKSKEDLVLAVLEEMWAQYQLRVIQPIEDMVDPGERIAEMFTRIVALNESGQWPNDLLLVKLSQETAHQEGAAAEQVRNTINWLVEFWSKLLAEGQSANTVRKDLNPHRLAKLVVSTWFGAVICWELDSAIGHFEEILREVQLLITPLARE